MGSAVFTEYTLAGMKLRNRIVRSATFDPYGAEDGTVSEEQTAYYRTLAENQTGLIITGMYSVTPGGTAGPLQIRAYDDYFLPGHRALTDAVHKAGGKVVAQINHAGDRSKSPLPPSPSGLASPGATGPSHEMTLEEIAAVTADFAGAAVRMRDAGYDGVQLHFAHGYLVSQFLNPKFNRRTDAYGGSAGNRFRFAEEILAAVTAAVGPEYPVLIKINSNLEEGDEAFEPDLIQMCRRCRELGACAVELSGFDFTPRGRAGGRNYYLDRAGTVRAACGLPVILVGGIRSLDDMDAVLNAGVDLAAVCRPFICEPDLVLRLLGGQQKASCLSCSKCFILQTKYKTDRVRCVLHQRPAGA